MTVRMGQALGEESGPCGSQQVEQLFYLRVVLVTLVKRESPYRKDGFMDSTAHNHESWTSGSQSWLFAGLLAV